MADSYFRIIKGLAPTPEDFLTQRQLGNPLRNPKFEREWAGGISVSDTLEAARTRARQFRGLGNYIVEVQVPDSSGIEVRQTTRDQHHYTIFAFGLTLLDSVVGDAIPVAEESESD